MTIDTAKVYDEIAEIYDSRYTDEACQVENKQVAELVRELHPSPFLLDVGCGTGLALELELAKHHEYVGLDPSRGMLNHLIAKFPDTAPNVLHATFENAYDLGYIRHCDVVISMFGSPSYVLPEYQERMIDLGGHGLVMHYVQGYWPDYEDETPYSNDARQAAEEAVLARNGVIFELNKFQVGVW